MTIAEHCRSFADEINSLEHEKRDLGEELQQAAPPQKPALVAQIRKINIRIDTVRRQLNDCQGIGAPLNATMAGLATLITTKPEAPGPYSTAISITVRFTGVDSVNYTMQVTAFPQLSFTFPTPVGVNVTTISKIDGGLGTYAQGEISLPITLRFDQSLDFPLMDEDSDLPLTLSTDSPGSPVNANNQVVMSGTNTFSGGFLEGSSGTVTISGTFSDVP